MKLKTLVRNMLYALSRINILERTLILYSGADLGFSGNIKYGYEKITKSEYFSQYKVVYLSKDRGKGVYLYSLKGIMYALFTKNFIINVQMPPFVSCKHKNVIQLWHGIPVKCIGKNAENYSSEVIDKIVAEFKEYNYIFTSGDGFTQLIKESFCIEDDSKFICSKNFVQSYLIEMQEKYINKAEIINILYAPTFRTDGIGGWNLLRHHNELIPLLEEINARLTCKYHPSTAAVDRLDDCHDLINVKDDDLAELLLCSDIIITDYSSVIFDAALLKKEIYLYCEDFDMYMKSRGKCAKEVFSGFNVCLDVGQLVEVIRMRKGINAFSRVNSDFHEYVTEGDICQRIVELL